MKNAVKIMALFVFAFIIVKPVTAFISPDTISLIVHSIGSILWNLIIIVAASVLVFVVNTSKKIKKVWILIIIFFLVVTFVIYVNKLTELKQLNLAYENKEDINLYLRTYMKERLIDFENINNKSIMNRTQKINIYNALENKNITILSFFPYNITGTLPINRLLFFYYIGNKTKIDSYLLSMNISKKDDLVLFCETGLMSSKISMVLNKYGYNTKYATLYTGENENNFDYKKYLAYDFNSNTISTDIIIDDIKYNKKSDYIYLVFNTMDYSTPMNVNLIKDINKKIIVVSYKDDFPDWFTKGLDDDRLLSDNEFHNALFDKEVKIICENILHCVLTREFLEYNNLDYNKIIYHVSKSEELFGKGVKSIPELDDKIFYYKWNPEE